jgi:2-amino-4-hydroxy-6-hydroxymethyldihydropteridine diphosphokinase
MNAAAEALAATAGPRWLPAYVGVGSNLDDPAAQVRRAVTALGCLRDTRLVASSPLYQTPPFGAVVQPAFVNAVAGLLTQLSPEDLLAELRALEAALGRQPPRERWGPRVIDLDLLVMGRETRGTPELTLPHPGIVQRDFVLYPLADLAPDLEIAGAGRVAVLKARVQDRGVRRL